MNRSVKRVFVTDCEGPLTKNDNAAEMAEAFLPQGAEFFSKVSLYDDYLAEIAHKADYKAGDTLRLILPFFKAFGVDDRTMVKFSRRNIQVIPYVQEALNKLTLIAPCYIVSTSYTPYIRAVCDALAFPLDKTFSTEVNIDSFTISQNDKVAVKDFYSRIMDLSAFSLPQGATSIEDLSQNSRETVKQLDNLFWQEMPRLAINELLVRINPIGGKEKALAIEKIFRVEGCQLKDVIYFGDSITDIDAFRLVKEGGGLAVSFNGNDWAVREASLAITASNALPIAFIGSMFLEYGMETLEDLLVTNLNQNNLTDVTRHSVKVRKSVRSEKIGSLG